MAIEITGTIDHRILLNYRIDPDVLQAVLPPELRPKLVNGKAIAGICQVSLSHMRPKPLPRFSGTHSHNAAHRVAVTSSQGDGVFVTRRDTSSWVNAFSGGRFFPGVYRKAGFTVTVSDDHYMVDVKSDDGSRLMFINAAVTNHLPAGSTFDRAENVSEFFETGNVGWSAKAGTSGFDAIELKTAEWHMEPLKVREQFSAFFTDRNRFPPGTVEFDSAMIMRGLEHSWIPRDNLCRLCA